MNKVVSFELAKLLKEKGYDEYSKYAIGIIHNDIVSVPPEFGLKENEDVIYGVLCNSRMDEFNSDYISAPTIADVVMWLYGKYGVWIVVNITISSDWYFELYDLNSKRNAEIKVNVNLYSSPSEAYESAIKHYLTKNIKP